MIRINLLPLDSFRQTASGKMSLTIFAVCMLALGGLLYVYNMMFMAPRLVSLDTQKTQQTSRLNQIKSQANQALKQTTSFVDQMVQVSTISVLEERRRDQARLFMALAGQINNQASWLQTVSHRDTNLIIRGMATDNETVGMLLSRLEQLPLLRNVKLGQAAGGQIINNVRLVTFDINAETVFPAPSLIENGLPDIKLPDNAQIKDIVAAINPDLAKALERNQELARML
ncbi:MAG: PilN domain-containing protein [Deltaproteobacteria bacterium]|jgi:Tfp pilus assembly protein PilN|nr:PilN domain-containing protein [Deltaproteobacteria bacterium]